MIKIRFAKQKEIKTIKNIYKKAFWDSRRTKQFHYFLQFINKERIRKKEILIAHFNGRSAGFCSFYYNSPVFSESMFLEDTAVLPEYQKKGIGLAFSKKVFALAKAKKLRRIFSSTWRGNKAAIKLNKKRGSEYCGRIVNGGGEHEDYVFFSKKI
ncbi:MAG: GNAT family N-acetyltransferase [DPANN group archaeon]|nr:GNAT family N-acetyltransferase [DPANN group archaeon]